MLEADLAAFCGARHAITCASGTDALLLVADGQRDRARRRRHLPELHVLRDRRGRRARRRDAGLRRRGGRRASTSIRQSVQRAVAAARKPGLTPRRSSRSTCSASRPIMRAIAAIARRREPVRARRCRAGVRRDLPQPPASARFGDATATSFFPAKPLGCYGDGGAVLTDDDELAADHAQSARAWRGRRQIRLRAHRHERPLRHHPGGGADREAERSSPTRSQRATASRSAIRRSSPTSRSCRAWARA